MWLTGLVALRHVGSSQTRARTRVPCISRQTLNHCTTREAPGIGFDDDDDVYLAYNIYNVFIIYFISLNKKNTWQKVKYSKSKAQKTRVYFVYGHTQIGKAEKKKNHPIKTLTNTINSEFLWRRMVGGGRDCLGKITKRFQL